MTGHGALERELARERELIGGTPPDALGRWSWRAFIACALVAIGFGVSVLYSAGRPTFAIDVTRELEGVRGSARSTNVRVGPYRLDPGMNAMRFVLNTSHAPLGRVRRRYVLALENSAGKVFWRVDGRLNGRDAKIVLLRTKLEPFEVPRADEYWIRVRGQAGSMDDLRAATLELRTGVSRVDPRLPWAFAFAAVACLIVNVFTVIRRPRTVRAEAPATQSRAA